MNNFRGDGNDTVGNTNSLLQTLAHALHQMLEVALQFTKYVLFMLEPSTQSTTQPGGASGPLVQSALEEKLQRGSRRAAAARASKLSAQFKQEVCILEHVVHTCVHIRGNVVRKQEVHIRGEVVRYQVRCS